MAFISSIHLEIAIMAEESSSNEIISESKSLKILMFKIWQKLNEASSLVEHQAGNSL